MLASVILTTAFAASALAAPHRFLPRQANSTTYYGVSLNAQVTPGLQSPGEFEPIPMPLNTLVEVGNLSCSALYFDKLVSINVNSSSVECRAYKDVAGVVPGSAPFTLASPAYLSTNLVVINSILCYVTEQSQISNSTSRR